MADLRTLTLALVADIDKFKKGLDKAEGESKSFSQKLEGVLKKGALAFGALGVAAGGFAAKIGKDAVLAAADFNEELSKSEVIFGDAAKGVQTFAKTATRSIGLNRLEALRAASNFAIFGKSAGLSGKELETFSTDFVTLAADLASFNNTTPEQAILAIGSALRGESEPIRNYGVLINEASLKQVALRDGIIQTTKDALTPQEKVLATTKLLFEQTLDAQGDFDRTKDSFTNTLKTLRQSWEDIRIEIGEKLLPVFGDLLTRVKKDILPVFQTFISTLIGGPNSLDESSYFAFKAQENLGNKLGDNEYAGYNLALAVRDLASAFGDLFREVEAGTGEGSSFAQFINDLATIIGKIADAIRGIDNLIERLGGLKRALQIFGGGGIGFLGGLIGAPSAIGAFNESRAQSQSIVSNLAANQRRANTAPIVVNVRGAIDPQGTARTVSKVLTQQRAISGVRVTAPAGFF